MNVFITGGTGYLGSVIVERFVAAGHTVTALARSERSAVALTAAGAEPVRGSLDDTAVLATAAEAADAVVHAAVDYSGTEAAVATELAAVAALLDGAGRAGRNAPFLYTSTGLVYGFDPAQDRSEDAELPEASAQPVKVAAERLVLDAPGVTPIVIRAGLVYGRGGSGLVTGLLDAARAQGVATYIGDGANNWTPVHVDDLADLFLAAVERPAAGVYNAVGDVPFTFGALAEAIAANTGATPTSITAEAAVAAMGPAAQVLATSAETAATKAKRVFGWAPSRVSLLDDVRSGSYAA